MRLFVGFGVGMLVVFVFAVVLGAVMMWIAAKIARVEKSSFGRAVLAAIGTSFVSVVASFVFHHFLIVGNLLGFVIGLVLTVFVIKAAFDTTFGKALLVWIFNVVATVLAVIAATIIAAGSLFGLMSAI